MTRVSCSFSQRSFTFVVLLIAAVGCKGEKGDAGAAGSDGPSGDAGTAGTAGTPGTAGTTGPSGDAGPQGTAGTAGASTGTVTGTVRDTNSVGLSGATISTSPTSTTTSTDGSGNFSLASVPSGVYSVIATLASYGTSTVTGVSVTTGGSSSTSFVLYLSDGGFASISGTVTNTAGVGIANATVTVSGVDASAVTDSTGSYTITNVPAPGPYFLDVTPPSVPLTDGGFLAGDTRVALTLTRTAHTDAGIILSARPSSAATYMGTGTASCTTGCHNTYAGDTTIPGAHASSAHWRSLSLDGGERFINTSLWPSVGGTVDTAIYAQDPNGIAFNLDAGGNGGQNRVYLCQNTTGNYAMMFGPNPDAGVDAGCTGAGGATQGILVPVAGTYGGEGDRATWDGGIVTNLGKFKQRFLARVNDVDSGAVWTYVGGKDKDLLILPVQITQSGDGNPKYATYKETVWADRNRTFAYACAGCHNTNMSIAWNPGANDYILNYSYTDLNIGCERCHGPGSEHVGGGGGKGRAIINPKYLNANYERQVCGQCHSGDKGVNEGSLKKYSYAYNLNYADAGTTMIGRGTYVPGFYDISEFISNYATGGSFDAWSTIYGTKTYGKAHRQQYAMLLKSKHVNNTTRRMTCASCHDVHSLYQGPKAHTVTSGSDTFVFGTPRFNNNVLCLSCHAGSGEFASVATSDVAAIHVGDSRAVSKNGSNQSFTSGEISSALTRVGDAVETHMNAKANMGLFVMYDPEREPGVGRCMNCHMPRTAKSGGYTTGKDTQGFTALIKGDQGSHVFDIIKPQMSRIMTDGGVADDAVMPNSCGVCHIQYRFSGDGQ